MSTEKQLLKIMNENGVTKIFHSYCGSGDGGGTEDLVCYDKAGDELPVSDVVQSIVEDIVFDTTQANFNDEGSSGEMTFTVDDTGLRMEGYHREFYESHNDTAYDRHIYEINDPEDET